MEGRVLEQLCFGRHELILNFDDGLSITVEGAAGITLAGDSESVVADPLDIASVLVGLISDTVRTTEVKDARSFSIEFARGQVLRLIDSSERYESFQVRHGDRLIVV